jgi:hypothetical protein
VSNDHNVVARAIDNLGEHFDTVQIFCTRNGIEDQSLVNVTAGIGSWYARYGQVKDFILRAEERVKCDIRAEYDEQSDDGEEDNE